MKFFITLTIVLFFSVTANAQQQTMDPSVYNFLMQEFPNDMPQQVINNATIQPVDEEYASENRKKKYQYFTSNPYEGPVRQGDTVLVYKGKAFFSTGQNCLMAVVPKEKKVRNKKGSGQNSQVLQTVIQTGVRILPAILQKATGVYAGGGLHPIGG